MIEIEAINKVAEGIVELYKKGKEKQNIGQSSVLQNLGIIPKNKKQEPISYFKGYTTAADWLQQIRAHAEKGFFPEWLFENNSPNMTQAEREYQRLNFRQDTLEVFKDLVDTNGRAYHQGNYEIQWPEEADQYTKQGLTFKQYMTTELPVYESIETFNFEFLPPLKFMDAEGHVAILPGNIPSKEINGELVVDPDTMLSPYPEFFHCTKTLYTSPELIIIESTEKSDVTVGDKTLHEGFVFWSFTDTDYMKIVQTGEKSDYEFEVVPILKHDLGYIPVKKVGGLTVKIDDVNLEQSPFLYAVDTLDRILIDSSLLASSKANCCFPYRVMIGDPCEAKMEVEGEPLICDNGYFHLANGSSFKCGTCGGNGLKDRITATGVMLIKPPQSTQDGEAIKPSEALFYAGPSPELFTKLRQEIDYNFTKSYNLLHLKRDNSKIQAGQPVTATEIDGENKALIAGVTLNASQLFALLSFEVETIGRIRYGENLRMPIIKPPVSYDFLTIDEYLKKVSSVIADNQPSVMVQSVIRDAANRVFFKDQESKMVFELISKTDRLMAMTDDAINMKQSKRLIDNWEVILHDSIMMFIDELKAENPKFFESPLAEQKKALIEKAKAFAATIAPIQSANNMTAANRLNTLLGSAA